MRGFVDVCVHVRVGVVVVLVCVHVHVRVGVVVVLVCVHVRVGWWWWCLCVCSVRDLGCVRVVWLGCGV